MANEAKELAEAFAKKDKVEGFLVNLDKLRADGTIVEEQYQTLKEEYNARLSAAISEIAQIKNILKEQLETIQRDIDSYKFELGKLETKYKVGELPLEKYQASDQKFRAKIEGLETTAQALTMLIEANSSADIGISVKKPKTAAPKSPQKKRPSSRVTPSPVKKPKTAAPKLPPVTKVAAPAKEVKPLKAKPPKARATEISPLTRAAPSAEGFLTPRTKLLAMAGGALLLISIFLPWIAASELLGKELGSDSGMNVSNIIGAVGIIFGVAIVATAVLFSGRARGAVQIIVGILALVALLAIILAGMLPLLSEYFRTLIVIREGLYLYVIAAVALIFTGIFERRQE